MRCKYADLIIMPKFSEPIDLMDPNAVPGFEMRAALAENERRVEDCENRIRDRVLRGLIEFPRCEYGGEVKLMFQRLGIDWGEGSGMTGSSNSIVPAFKCNRCVDPRSIHVEFKQFKEVGIDLPNDPVPLPPLTDKRWKWESSRKIDKVYKFPNSLPVPPGKLGQVLNVSGQWVDHQEVVDEWSRDPQIEILPCTWKTLQEWVRKNYKLDISSCSEKCLDDGDRWDVVIELCRTDSYVGQLPSSRFHVSGGSRSYAYGQIARAIKREFPDP